MEWKLETIIAAGALIVSLVSLLFSIIENRYSRSEARKDLEASDINNKAKFDEIKRRQDSFYGRTEARELSLKTMSVYMELEVNSSKIFEYTAERSHLMAYFRATEPDPGLRPSTTDYDKCAETTLNLYFQSLNLFEVCAHMYRHDLFPRDVFGSWIAWFYEVLDDWYFQEQWPQIRENYTQDVRAIFDIGTDIFRYALDDEDRLRAFYDGVATAMAPRVAEQIEIGDWLDRAKKGMSWDSVPSKEKYSSPGTNPKTLLLAQPPLQQA